MTEVDQLKEQLREARSQSRVHRQHRMLYQGQRDELRKKLKSIKEHWFEEVPPFTMPFLDCQDDSVQKYIKDMTEWGRIFANILEDRNSEGSTD